VNLTSFLYHEARLRESTPEPKAAAREHLGARAEADSRLFERRGTENLGTGHRVLPRELRGQGSANQYRPDPPENQLGDFEDCDELLGRKKKACDAGLPGNTGVILEAAAPVYGPTGGQITIAQTGAGSRELRR